MKHGFTLLELVIALMISSLVGISLYQMFFQTSRTVKEIIQVIQADEPLYPLFNQLDNDITGMFTPHATVDFYLKAASEARDKKTDATAKAANKDDQPKQLTNNDDEKKPDNTIKKVFFVETKDTGYLFLSFITTGGISHLEANGKVAPNDFVRRVAYVIQDNPSRPGTLSLFYRTNNQSLDIDFIKKPDFYPSYRILDGIKNFSIEFTIFEAVSSDNQDKAKGNSKVVLKEWKEEEIFEKYKALIPAYITIKGEYADDNSSGDQKQKPLHAFEFDFKVYGYNNYELPVPPASKQPVVAEQAKPSNTAHSIDKISKFFEGAFGTKSGNSPTK